MANLIPAWCIHCRAFINHRIQSESPFLCATCYLALPTFDSSICLKCGRSHDPGSCQSEWAKRIDRVFSVFSYEDPIREWISSLKYNRNFIIGRMFQGFIREWLHTNRCNVHAIDSIVPIPMHPGRLFKRGFNQSVYLLNKQKEIPIDTRALKKKTRTSQQAGKSKRERIANLKNAFQATKDFSDKRVLLFDDVCTTGQTLSEASRVVAKAGAKQIDVLVLSRSLNLIKPTSNSA